MEQNPRAKPLTVFLINLFDICVAEFERCHLATVLPRQTDKVSVIERVAYVVIGQNLVVEINYLVVYSVQERNRFVALCYARKIAALEIFVGSRLIC